MLRISDSLELPLEAATRATAVLGVRGSGKTFTAAVLTEELAGAGVPVVVLDPVGVWWGLRSPSADAEARGPGLPFVIFGGDHADVPLGEESGELVADVVLAEQLCAVLDLSQLRKGAAKRFTQDFAERLYHRSRTSMHLVVDEADFAAPQRPLPGEQRLLGAMEDIVRRGRARGIGCTLISQRPQALHKDVLTQCEILIAMRVTHPRDVEAIEAWVELHGTDSQREKVIKALPSLPTGTGFVWSPAWDMLERVKVRSRHTFDSSATPKPGEQRLEPRGRAAIDIEALSRRIGATIQRAKEEDPKALRARIAELEAELAARPNAEPERVEVYAMDPGDVDTLRNALRELGSIVTHLVPLHADLARAVELLGRQTCGEPLVSRDDGLYRGEKREAVLIDRLPRIGGGDPSESRRLNGTNGAGLRKGAREMLRALGTMHPRALTRAQIATLAGLGPTSGTFSTYLGDLRGLAYIEDAGATEIAITKAGLRVVGTVPRPATTDELRGLWGSKLRAGARRMLDALIARHPKGMTRDELGRTCDLAPESGTFSTYLGNLTSNGLAEKRGREVFASSSLFIGGRR